MTQLTGLSIVEALKARGVEAYYEYPGYVSVVDRDRIININDLAGGSEPLTMEIVSPEDHTFVGCIDTDIPCDSTNVPIIVAAFMLLIQPVVAGETVAEGAEEQ